MEFSINGSTIIGISNTLNSNGKFIKFAKNCMGKNSPNRDLFMTGEHLVESNNKLVMAKKLVNGTTITKVSEKPQNVYNILLNKHEIINIHNMPVESLNPMNLGSRKISEKSRKIAKSKANSLFKR